MEGTLLISRQLLLHLYLRSNLETGEKICFSYHFHSVVTDEPPAIQNQD